jgi:acyl-CoA thioesterase-2
MTDTPYSTATLQNILTLEQLDDAEFRAAPNDDRRERLYGGQVAAQALIAAGATVPEGREPHSLHGYFLRSGRAGAGYTLRVMRDLDGNRYSNRRVEAYQDGALLFTMTVSFQTPSPGVNRQLSDAPRVDSPDASERVAAPLLVDIDYRVPSHAEADIQIPDSQGLLKSVLPTKFWVRSKVALLDSPLVHAAVLTYVSDWSSGLVAGHQGPWVASISLDHAMWFHRPIRLDEWTLFHLSPRNAADGRGWYAGHVFSQNGVHGTTFTQEALYGRTTEPPPFGRTKE